MKLFYRTVIFLTTLLFMFASLLLAIYCFGLTEGNLLPQMVGMLYRQWEAGVLFIIAFIAGAWIIYPFFVKEKEISLISKNELGVVNISINALDNLVNNIASEQEGIISIDNRLKATEEGLMISLNGQVNPTIPIPAIAENLQTVVKTYIEETTGVQVAGVRVLVEGVSEKKGKKMEIG